MWGEGGCAKNGLTFPEYLSEIASYGFVIVADGPPVQNGGRGDPAARKAVLVVLAARRAGARVALLREPRPPKARAGPRRARVIC